DHRADIYSVGVIMYEQFTGKVPFEAESFMGILTKHITTQPLPPRQVAPERDIPVEIEAVILCALAKEAEERYQSMSELSAELAAIAGELAPEVLMPRPSSQAVAQIGKPLSAAMASRTATPRPTPMPKPMPKPPSGAQPVEALDETRPVKKSAAPYFAVAAVLVAAAAGAVVWVTRAPAQAATTQTPTTTTTQPPAAIVQPPKQVDPPAAPAVEEVIVDSVPPGAKIFVDDVAVADTPEAIKVDKGKTKTVVLKKDGFVDRAETIDPDKSHKILVRLEHVKKVASAAKGGKPSSKLPAPPPATIDAPPKATPLPVVAQPSRPAPAQPPRHKKPIDPYERVDENSPKKPADVLNPY
ncbi:MAG TPA: PEGA domain-containing protein, partial [Polyangia bacterium]|nr:PEGA domain-containing protein [Polyangia bacterium]